MNAQNAQNAQEKEKVLASLRRSLGRQPGDPVAARPAVLPARPAGPPEAEIERLLQEVRSLAGHTRRLDPAGLAAALADLVQEQAVKKATLWLTPELAGLGLEAHLAGLGVEIVSPQADKRALAECDLGVTGVDFALPETGTLGLLSSAEQPRAVSLLPRVHLALLTPQALRGDLHAVFAAARQHPYLIFITGPSRTADIELTVTLGVHGPRELYVWSLE